MCKSKWFKRYTVELYDDNDIEIETYVFERKSEQMEKYYRLLNKGHKKSQIVKKTIQRLEEC